MKTHIACIVGLSLGILMLCGGEPPGWLLKVEVLLFSMGALAYGYTAFAPAAPSWFWSQPVRGMLCIYLGVGAMFVPAQFLVSALFIGIGTRMVMQSFPTAVMKASSTGISLRREPGDIVIRPTRQVATRD